MGVIKNKKWFFIFLLPGLLFYILSVFYPIEESIRLSFMEWNGIGDKTFELFIFEIVTSYDAAISSKGRNASAKYNNNDPSFVDAFKYSMIL